MQIFDNQVRFGVHAGPQNFAYDEYLALWKRAEEMGYDWASVFDHFMALGGSAGGPCLEGFTLLAAMAAHTSRVRCAILVTGNTYRNPALVAKMGATIDQISGGRLELGLGAAWFEHEHRMHGIPFPGNGPRIRMLAETAKIVRSLWTEKATDFQGQYYTITDAYCDPKPLQQPCPPIWIGGGGEKMTLRVVAESADGWNVLPLPTDEFQHKLDVLAAHCKDVGRDPADIRKSIVFPMLVRETEAEVREALDSPSGPRTARGGETVITGTPEQAVDQLLPYLRMGLGDFLLRVTSPVDFETLELVAKKVAPAVKAGVPPG